MLKKSVLFLFTVIGLMTSTVYANETKPNLVCTFVASFPPYSTENKVIISFLPSGHPATPATLVESNNRKSTLSVDELKPKADEYLRLILGKQEDPRSALRLIVKTDSTATVTGIDTERGGLGLTLQGSCWD